MGVEAAEWADDLSPADSIEDSEAETGEYTADGTGLDVTLVGSHVALAGDQDEAVQEAASTETTEPPAEVGSDMEPGSREDDIYVGPPAGLAETPTGTDELSAAPAEAADSLPPASPDVEAEGLIDDTPMESYPAPAAAAQAEATPPPVKGSVIIQVFHDSEPTVVHTHPVVNDITLIGREDPRRDIFPDLDLGTLADKGVSATRVSRQHLRLLRRSDQYYLFVYRGSTGAQVNNKLIDDSFYGKRFSIEVGDRIILGGKVRLKLTRQG